VALRQIKTVIVGFGSLNAGIGMSAGQSLLLLKGLASSSDPGAGSPSRGQACPAEYRYLTYQLLTLSHH
jgi:hypothetical protein